MELPIHDKDYREDVAEAGGVLTSACHDQARCMGWHDEFEQIKSIDCDDRLKAKLLGHFVATKLMLSVSELAEAMEGSRKGLMDNHLPQYTMLGTELADCVIRVCDLAGLLDEPLGEIIAAKLLYNATRPDHQIAHREAEGGKSY